MMAAAEISFHLSWNPVVLIGCVLLAAVIAYFSYRRPIPPVGISLRIVLTTLRSLGLACLLLAIAEPVASLVSTTFQRPVVAILLDQSQSMTITDRDGKRDEHVRTFFRESPFQFGPDCDIRYFGFSNRLLAIPALNPDSIRWNGSETDIASAIREIHRMRDEQNIQACVLISDGDVTSGENPVYDAEDLGFPIVTIGVGDSSEQRDVLLSSVFANSIGYVESTIPIDATVRSTGCDGSRVDITVSEGSSVIQKKTLILGPDAYSESMQFAVTPKEEGIHKYTITVSPVGGELTERNNSRSFFIKVLKSKISVLLIAGSPSPDVAFVRRILALDKNISVKTYIQKSLSEFYEGTFSSHDLADADCLVLIGYPSGDASTELVRIIGDDIGRRKKPVLFIMSRTVDYTKLKILEPYLPFTITSVPKTEREVTFTLAPGQGENAMFRFSFSSQNEQDDSRSRITRWNSLPPIFTGDVLQKPKPESTPLATLSIQGVTLNDPLLISRSVQQMKSIAMMGYGIWRWELLVRPASYHQAMLSSFISNSVRWLTTREDSRRVVIAPTRQLYAAGESIEFTGQVYDENYRPIDNADVSVQIPGSTGTSGSPLHSVGNGRYETAIDGLPEGDYTYTGTARIDGNSIGDDRGRFSVGEMNVEFLQTRMNAPLLRQLAERTGGRFMPIRNAHSFLHDTALFSRLTSKEILRTREFTLWNSAWLLIGTILMFSIEWFLRKRSGML
jgi:hypothetical protein